MVTKTNIDELIPTIELSRVILRQLTPSDRDDLYEAYSDREAMKFRENPPLNSIEEAEEMVRNSLRLAEEGKSIRWGVEEKTTQRIIGTFIWKAENGESVSEIGYSFNKEWWNKGMASEVVAAMTSYLFQTQHVDVLTARAKEENRASIKVLEKTGFQKAGIDANGKFTFRKERPHWSGEVVIERAGLDDALAVQQIGTDTFRETFSEHIPDADINHYLASAFDTKRVTHELRDPKSEIYLARLDGTVIGYLKVNFGDSQTDIKDHDALEVERTYVLKPYQGKRIGAQLLDMALSTAREKNLRYVWLGVWENNLRAIRFYKKNGFVRFGSHTFTTGDTEQTDILMKVDLGK